MIFEIALVGPISLTGVLQGFGLIIDLMHVDVLRAKYSEARLYSLTRVEPITFLRTNPKPTARLLYAWV